MKVDGERLMRDLKDYYGVAALSGRLPFAMVDLIKVEDMAIEELLREAQKNGFDISLYVDDYNQKEEEVIMHLTNFSEQDKIDKIKIDEENSYLEPSCKLILEEIIRVLMEEADNCSDDGRLSVTRIMDRFRPAFAGVSNQIVFSLCKTLVEQGKVEKFKFGKTPLFRIIREEETCETDEIKVENQIEEPVSEKILKDVYKVLEDAADKYPDNCKLTVLQICGRASSEQCHLYENVSRACEVLTRRGEVEKERIGSAVIYSVNNTNSI